MPLQFEAACFFAQSLLALNLILSNSPIWGVFEEALLASY
jgi:hypothetical protein